LINFPNKIDDETTLFKAVDYLKSSLTRDYCPGDDKIFADTKGFPETGIVTLIDQKAEQKSSSFFYQGKTNFYFYGITLTDDSIDGNKWKESAFATLQVRAEHHNAILDAILASQKRLGKKSEKIGDSICARLNRITDIALKPHAWFTISSQIGFAPLTVRFSATDVKPNSVFDWNFGDGTGESEGALEVEHTYHEPGIFHPSLHVFNDYGSDVVKFNNAIKVLPKAPPLFEFSATNKKGKIQDDGTIRVPINSETIFEKADAWKIDDWINTIVYRFMPEKGGEYDVSAKKIDRGSFRIVKKQKFLDVVELENVWLWLKNNDKVVAKEYSPLANVFKTKPKTPFDPQSFSQGFHRPDQSFSGEKGRCLLYYNNTNTGLTNFTSYEGFSDVYFQAKESIDLGNWWSLSSPYDVYFGNSKITSYSGKTINSEPPKLSNVISTAWCCNAEIGYILTSDVFYKTIGVISDPVQGFRKVQHPGVSGKLFALMNEVYLFSSTGTIKKHDPITDSWSSVSNFCKRIEFSGCSDKQIYLSYDDNSFVVFDPITEGFTELGNRPEGENWLAGIF
jgi:PKD repeat protein